MCQNISIVSVHVQMHRVVYTHMLARVLTMIHVVGMLSVYINYNTGVKEVFELG